MNNETMKSLYHFGGRKMVALRILENVKERQSIHSTLEHFERSKILEVYFARMDGRVLKSIPEDLRPLYEIDLVHIRAFLLGRAPQETIFNKLFKFRA